MAKLEELTEESANEEETSDDTEGEVLTDLIDGIFLIRQNRNLLRVLSDPDFYKTITKRERLIMDNLADKMDLFLGDMETRYEE